MTIDSVKKMKDALCEKLKVSFGSTVEEASDAQMMRASALVLRDVMAERSVDTMRETRVGLAFKDVRCAEAQLVERFGQNFADA